MAHFSRQGFGQFHQVPLAPLSRVLSLFNTLSPPDDGSGKARDLITQLKTVGARLSDRLAWGFQAPILVAVLGATGTGKSKLFNTLVQGSASPSGYRRPTTMAPVFLGLAEAIDRVAARDSFLPRYGKKQTSRGTAEFDSNHEPELILLSRTDFRWPEVVLIDTPDFDSVQSANRKSAADIFARCDAVLFVTDAVKYADQASWSYLEKIRDLDKDAVIVVNRVRNRLSLDDFSSRIKTARLDRPILSLPDHSGLPDAEPLPSDEPAIQALEKWLGHWSGITREDCLVKEAQADWNALSSGLFDQLLPILTDSRSSLSRLQTDLNHLEEKTRDDLSKRLVISISGELKNSLTQQIQALFVRFDLLRYPRRLMAIPLNVIRDRVLAPLGVWGRDQAPSRTLDREIDRLFETNRETLVLVIQEQSQKAAELFRIDPVGAVLAESPEFQDLASNPDQIRESYGQVRADLESWIENRARELVKDLDLGEKMTFYLAQVVSLTLFVSIQVHTGGGFSFFDGLLDGVLAPVLSKITGHALSRDKVKAFETQSARIHLEGCRDLIRKQNLAYLEFLGQVGQGLEPVGALAEGGKELAKAIGALT